MNTKPVIYWTVSDIAKLFNVAPKTVNVWRLRYGPDRTDEQIARTPSCPQPDIILGTERPEAGWAPERAAEWIAWEASRPGSPGSDRARARAAQ